MNLDDLEKTIFECVETSYYFDGYASVLDGRMKDLPFVISNVNESNKWENPNSPAMISIARSLPVGYASLLSCSTTFLSTEEMKKVMIKQLNQIPSDLLQVEEIIHINYHEYDPHFTTKSLKTYPHPYSLLQQLQGYRKTFYIGSLLSAPGSYMNQEFVHDLFSLYF